MADVGEQLRQAMLIEAHQRPTADVVAAAPREEPKAAVLPLFTGGPSASYLRSVEAVKATQQEADAVVASARADADSAAQRKIVALRDAGQAAADAELAKQSRVAQVADVTRLIADIFGADVTNPESRSADLVKQIQSTSDGLRTRLQEIQQRASVTVLDDPLAFIINSLELPAMAATYNADAARLDVMKQSLNAAQQSAKDHAALAEKGIPAITAAQAAAEARKHQALAEREVAITTLEAIQTRVTLSQQVFSNAVTQAGVQKGLSDSQLQAAMARHQSLIDQIKHAETAEIRLANLEKAREMLQDVQLKKLGIANAAAALGWAPGTFLPSMFDKMNANMQLRFISGGIAGDFGANPYDAYKTLRDFAGPRLSDSLKGWMHEFEAVVSAAATDAAKNKLTGQQLENFLAVKTAELVKERLNAPVTASNTLLKELSPRAMAEAYPNFVRSIAGTVLKPLIENPGNPTTQTVVDTIATGLREKGVPVSGQAYAIAQYYGTNVAQRNKNSNADAVKVEVPQNYKVVLDLPIGAGGARVYDLTKPEQVQLYLLRKGGYSLLGFVDSALYATSPGQLPAGLPGIGAAPPASGTPAPVSGTTFQGAP